jgi:hypothetical protein
MLEVSRPPDSTSASQLVSLVWMSSFTTQRRENGQRWVYTNFLPLSLLYPGHGDTEETLDFCIM